MLLSEALLDFGEEEFGSLVRGISLGKLRTYQMYESFKVRARLHKLNTDALRKSIPAFRVRLAGQDEEFAKDLAQVMLLSHLGMVGAVLGFLGIPNEDGFFAKDLDATPYLTPGWQQRVYEKFRSAFPEPALVLYINHLTWELDKKAGRFAPS